MRNNALNSGRLTGGVENPKNDCWKICIKFATEVAVYSVVSVYMKTVNQNRNFRSKVLSPRLLDEGHQSRGISYAARTYTIM